MLKLLSENLQKKKKKKERKIIALLPKILHIVLHGKLEKINEYVLYVKKESNMQINIDNYVKLLSIFFLLFLSKNI